MSDTAFGLDDVERLANLLDSSCAGLDERDQALLHAIFASAGATAAAAPEDEADDDDVVGYSFRSALRLAGLDLRDPSRSAGGTLYESFKTGLGSPGRRVNLLSRFGVFASCDVDELLELDSIGDEITVAPGRVLAQRGAAARQCFVILEGSAVETAAERAPRDLAVGSAVGHRELMAREASPADVVASTGLTVLVLNRAQLESAISRCPGIVRQFLPGLLDNPEFVVDAPRRLAVAARPAPAPS